MENNKTKAKDFFMQLGLMVALYAGVVALLNILFRVINILYPQVDAYYGSSSISFPVATLLVVFPIILVLANMINKGYVQDPSRKDFFVRNWLIYITLFIAGIVLAGDVVTLLYFFIDGRELTAGFLLKVLAVAVVGGSVFGYFFDDLRNKLTGSRRNMWRVVATILVIGSIVLGFAVIGTPQKQRAMRYDDQKIMDLQNIQNQVVYYWQTKEVLPTSLEDLKDSLSTYEFVPTNDSQGKPYVYSVVGPLSFELCADFNYKSKESSQKARDLYYYGGAESGNWQHEEGTHCFERTIDPERHRPFEKNI